MTRKVTAPHLKTADTYVICSNLYCAYLSLLQMQSKIELFKTQLFPFIHEDANARYLTVAHLKAEASNKRAITS